MIHRKKLKRVLQADLLKAFRENKVPEEMIKNLEEKIAELGEFIPTVGIFGKTGVGKSSLCNALFGKDTARVADIDACTRHPQEVFIQMSQDGSGITVIDLPGVGENKLRDAEYKALYQQVIPKLDLIIWVIKADDRTFTVDESFYDEVIKPQLELAKTPFLVVVNQVDRLNPIRDWNTEANQPGLAQMKTIGERTHWASDKFRVPTHQVIAISAVEKYNLGALVEAIIDIVPNDKKLGFLNQMEEDVTTEKSEQSAFAGIVEYLKDAYKEIKPYIPEIIAALKWLFKVAKTIVI
ncbi:GTPase family protein [Caenimonas koreensis]|nr:GTPase [Caenimonas koreensis]